MSNQKKKIGERTTFERNSEGLKVIISQRAKQWQEALIGIWICLWVICGFMFLSQYFLSETSDQKAFIIGFFGIWAFILYKAIKIFIWRIAGQEEIIISDKEFYYKKSFSGLGRIKKCKTESISEFGLISYSDRSFKKNMESYFWNMGAQTIGFKSSKGYFMMGMQLDKKESKLLSELLKDGIKKY